MPRAPRVPEIVFETINGFISRGWIPSQGKAVIDMREMTTTLGANVSHLDEALYWYHADWIFIEDGNFLRFTPRPASDDGEK